MYLIRAVDHTTGQWYDALLPLMPVVLHLAPCVRFKVIMVQEVHLQLVHRLAIHVVVKCKAVRARMTEIHGPAD